MLVRVGMHTTTVADKHLRSELKGLKYTHITHITLGRDGIFISWAELV